jgi:hypothetical protein
MQASATILEISFFATVYPTAADDARLPKHLAAMPTPLPDQIDPLVAFGERETMWW